MAKVGVLLSGCGVQDGSEIHEAVLTMLHLDKNGQEIIPIAPNILQSQVIDHLTGDEMERENRDVLVEAARIARGDIRTIKAEVTDQLDGLILPGGAGAVKNLTNYALMPEECKINQQTEQLIIEMIETNRPVGAICIAPLVVARALADTDQQPKVTVGAASEPAKYIEDKLDAVHVEAAVDEVVVDDELKILTTPAYMLAESIAEAEEGIAKLVARMADLI
ncbi:isoprenoid biosynthesis glyoxalase ElbB [Acetohalobium arabaticum]|uniref:ThiJ/PfpI domain protein n=1 Tax=Acetohalobium arabaticum (strain ATCC 49924 / DSM 5501 / Z-7288) TaxID=574087 RepID=D9QT89_ACEAZ|nr:isoprenoid biosynthesis glyoxalase ElbB [Acetohalobium arabaticum]ADL13589.1 ThiJ/PfpI domain protein [Acetohalobium arabaticum DSM 5501]